jgi:hypothetical protein
LTDPAGEVPVVSYLRRLEPFLYSRRNIAGCALALGGLALYVLGITGGLIGLGLVAALYGVGYLVVRPERGVPHTLDANQDADNVRLELERLVISIHGRVADDIYSRVQSIRDSVLATLPQTGDAGQSLADPNVYLIRKTALAYLPQALDAYLAVPRIYAERRAVADGRTPHDVLLDQLNLMDSKMREVAEDLVHNDTEKLVVHGRFLQERFADTTLKLTPAKVGVDRTIV